MNRWYVKADRTPVNWAAAVVGGIAQTDIFEVRQASTEAPATYLVARAGSPVAATTVTRAQQQQAPGAAPTARVPDPQVRQTKRVTMSLGAPRTQNAAAPLTNWAERIPILTPVRTTRWRLRVANRLLNINSAPVPLTQQFTLGDVFLGAPGARSPGGRPLGNWASAPRKVLDGALLTADGSDWVSPWVTDPAAQFGPDTVQQIGLAMSGTNNGNGSASTSSHYGHRSIVAGANAALATQLDRSGYFGANLALDKRIEYEFEGDNPVGLYVGPSGDEGYHLVTALDGSGGYEVVPVWETYPGAYGMRTRTPWVNAAITGAQQAPFMDKNSLAYSRFDLQTTVPDFCIASMGGNAVLNNVPLATVQAETASVVAAIRALGVNRIYLSTIVPAALTAADTREVLRKQFNDWVRTVPLGVHGIIDVDLLLRDPASKLVQEAGFVSADNLHPNHAGLQRWADGIPVLR